MDKPMNVEQIVRMVGEPVVDLHIPLQQWFRTAELMLKQARIYEREANYQMAYFLLYRHARLILNDLVKHPQAGDPKYRVAWVTARESVGRSLAKLELLKPQINKRFDRYQELLHLRAAKPHAEAHIHLDSADSVAEAVGRISLDSQRSTTTSRSQSPDRLNPIKHQDLAIRQANQEIRRRISGLSDQFTGNYSSESMEDTSSRMIDARREIDRAGNRIQPDDNHLGSSFRTPYIYPHVLTKTKPLQSDEIFGEQAPFHSHHYHHPLPKYPTGYALSNRNVESCSKPLMEPADNSFSAHLRNEDAPGLYRAPSLPEKTPLNSASPLPTHSISSTAARPQLTHQFSTSSSLESGFPLRTIFLPSTLRYEFLHVAKAKTIQNLETCGILCGTLIRNAFFITKLVIPEQTSTSDTCEMVDEAALLEYCDAQPEELMVLGWIHTHPTQTCFMSSRDLHTHCWYQVQLPESIAIVCAPSKHPDFGIFRLTDPPGMQAIRTCKHTGIFHPHDESHIFTDALGRPGHVIEHKELHFEVVDLRL